MKVRFADRAALAVGRQLACPAGPGGRAVAALMRFVNRKPTRALIDALQMRPGHQVLDVGCGDGAALAALPDGTHRFGLDRSETMLAIADRRLNRRASEDRVRLREGDMLKLPFGEHSFDRILASNVLYFCPDIPAFIAECRRVARPGALLGIYVTAAELMASWPFAGPRTHRHFTRQELQSELDASAVERKDQQIRALKLSGGVHGLIVLARVGC